MQPIPTLFEDRTFRYTQLVRQGDVALYEQRHKRGPAVRYEVVRIRVQPETTWPNGDVTPEREMYPGSSVWGKYGWTFITRPEAEAWLEHLQTAPSEPEEDAEPHA